MRIVVRKRASGKLDARILDDRGVVYLHGDNAMAKAVMIIGEHAVARGVGEKRETEADIEYILPDEMLHTVIGVAAVARKSRALDEKWADIIKGVVEGRYEHVAVALDDMARAMIEASERLYKVAPPSRVKTVVHPRVADAFGAGMKKAIEKLVKLAEAKA